MKFISVYKTADAKDSNVGPNKIYIGDLAASRNLRSLREHNIRVVINCTYTSSCCYENEFEYLRLHFSDDESQDLEQVLLTGTKFLQEQCANKNVLVHCRQGVSRSVSVVLAWMLRYQGLTLCQALKKVREKHPDAAPNLSFLQQLSEYASRLQGHTNFDQLQCCKICSKLGFSQEYVRFSKCGHSICRECKQREANQLFCPHCLVEVTLENQKTKQASRKMKPTLRRSEILPLAR